MGMYEQPMSAMSCRSFLELVHLSTYLPISLKTVPICLLCSIWTSLCSHDGWHKLHLLLNQLEWWSNPSVITSLTVQWQKLEIYYAKDTIGTHQRILRVEWQFHQVQDFGHSLWKLHAERETCDRGSEFKVGSPSWVYDFQLKCRCLSCLKPLSTPDSLYSILILIPGTVRTTSHSPPLPTASFNSFICIFKSYCNKEKVGLQWPPCTSWTIIGVSENSEPFKCKGQLEKETYWRIWKIQWLRRSAITNIMYYGLIQSYAKVVCFHDGMIWGMSGTNWLLATAASPNHKLNWRVRKSQNWKKPQKTTHLQLYNLATERSCLYWTCFSKMDFKLLAKFQDLGQHKSIKWNQWNPVSGNSSGPRP